MFIYLPLYWEQCCILAFTRGNQFISPEWKFKQSCGTNEETVKDSGKQQGLTADYVIEICSDSGKL